MNDELPSMTDNTGNLVSLFLIRHGRVKVHPDPKANPYNAPNAHNASGNHASDTNTDTHTHNARGHICYGQSDIPLLQEGKKALQADASRQFRIIQRFTAAPNATPKGQPSPPLLVVSSPLRRCRLQARFFCEMLRNAGIPQLYCEDDRLMELNFGDWELSDWQDILEKDAQNLQEWLADPMHRRPPAGESLRDLQTRVLTSLRHWLSVPNPTSKPIQPNSLAKNIVLFTHAGVIRSLLLLSDLSVQKRPEAPIPIPSARTPANKQPSTPANKQPSTPANKCPSTPANKCPSNQDFSAFQKILIEFASVTVLQASAARLQQVTMAKAKAQPSECQRDSRCQCQETWSPLALFSPSLWQIRGQSLLD